jgi:hypothetical protein
MNDDIETSKNAYSGCHFYNVLTGKCKLLNRKLSKQESFKRRCLVTKYEKCSCYNHKMNNYYDEIY